MTRPPGEPGGGGGRLSPADRRMLAYYRRVAALMQREPEAPGERSFWSSEIARSEDVGRALDLGCGSGRLTRLAAREVGRAVGVDLSRRMLRLAREGHGSGSGVSYVRGDVRALPVDPGWGLALAGGGVFGHLHADAARDRALVEVARVLRPGGRLLLDGLWLPRPDFERATGDVLRRERRMDAPEGSEPEVVREAWRCDPSTRICRVRFEYARPGGELHTAASFTARVWDEAELEERLEGAGFRLRRRWGDFRREPWDPGRSPRLLVDAVRR